MARGRPGRRHAGGRHRCADRPGPALRRQRRADQRPRRRHPHAGLQRRRHHARARQLRQVRGPAGLRLGVLRTGDPGRRCRPDPQGAYRRERGHRLDPRRLHRHRRRQRFGLRRHPERHGHQQAADHEGRAQQHQPDHRPVGLLRPRHRAVRRRQHHAGRRGQ